jgi:hypothetical protein
MQTTVEDRAKIIQVLADDHHGDKIDVGILCDELGIDKDTVEHYAYKFAQLFIRGFMFSGKSKGIKPEGIDPEEFIKGQKIEMEHTSDKLVALKIVYDHLNECPDYYKRLEILEKACEKDHPRKIEKEDVIIGTAGGEL